MGPLVSSRCLTRPAALDPIHSRRVCSCVKCDSRTWASISLAGWITLYFFVLLFSTGLALRRDANQPKEAAMVILKMTFTYLQTIGHFSFLRAIIPGPKVPSCRGGGRGCGGGGGGGAVQGGGRGAWIWIWIW